MPKNKRRNEMKEKIDTSTQEWKKKHQQSFPTYEAAKVAFDGLVEERCRIRKRVGHFDVVVYEKVKVK